MAPCFSFNHSIRSISLKFSEMNWMNSLPCRQSITLIGHLHSIYIHLVPFNRTFLPLGRFPFALAPSFALRLIISLLVASLSSFNHTAIHSNTKWMNAWIDFITLNQLISSNSLSFNWFHLISITVNTASPGLRLRSCLHSNSVCGTHSLQFL